MVAYIMAVYERYMAGDRASLSIENINDNIIDKLSDPYEYVWMGMK